MKVIEIKKLNYSIDEQQVLRNISLTIKEGEFISLLGSNGSGKSTLAKLIAGINEEECKEIKINSKPGIVLENPDNQIIGTLVYEDILFGLQNIKINKEKMFEKLEETLNKFKIKHLEKKLVNELSGGEKQKLAFASLWALDYEIFILDEVTSMLDPDSRKEIIELIKKLNNEGKTIIQITHFLEETKNSDRVIILNKGEIVADDKYKVIIKDKKLLRDNYLI